MKAQRGTVFLKLLHLSDFTEFRPSSETASQALLAPLSDFAHSVAPSAHREGHGERERERERERAFVKLFLLLSDFAQMYHHQSRKRDPSLSSSFCISHILLREAPSKHRERRRERERETNNVRQALSCLSNFAQSVAPSKQQQTQGLSSSCKRF
jgi:hypothetical protein